MATTTAFSTLELTQQDVAALRALVDEWVRLFLRADWDGLMKLFDDDVVLMPPDQPIVKGKKAARAFGDIYPPVTACEVRVDQVEGHEDLAVCRGTHDITVLPAPGKPVSSTGKWLATYRMQPDRTWLCTAHIWNADRPVSLT